MSTFVPINCKCAICGEENEFLELASTNSFGGPDLDLRPAEMQRNTMSLWIQECPNCGYISEEVSDPSDIDAEWLKSTEYLSCEGIDFVSDLAKKFYKHYMINVKDNHDEDAFFAVLHAAWACDDASDLKNARRCREIAIPLAQKLIESGHENSEDVGIVKADLMRRAGQFEQMIEEYADKAYEEDLLNQIMKYEIARAKEKDDACYRIEDVVGKDAD